MRRRALAAAFLLVPALARGASEAPPGATALAAPVPFLEEAPRVDGLLDEALAALPARPLPPPERSAPGNPATTATFRLAYGATFLWLFVESPGEALAFRDRAFQNGDGFHVVLAVPRPGGAPSEEFTVVAVSAVDRPAMEWTRRVAWYRGPDRVFVPLSGAARAATAAKDGRLGFELLLPWSDVAPLHPWLSPAVGINLAVVRAVGEREKNVHLLVPDRFVDSEGKPRLSAPLAFAPPAPARGAVSFVSLPAGRLRAGEPLRAVAVTAAAPGAEDAVTLRVRTAEGTLVATARAALRCAASPCRTGVDVDAGTLLPGGYRVEWTTRDGGASGEAPLTVLPALDAAAIAARLARLPPAVPSGTKATVELLASEADASLRRLPPYEAAGQERLALEEADALLRRAEAGEDPLAGRTGPFRRAFRSRRDGTLQPYALRVPRGGGAGRPVLLWLHGSGSDERALFGAPDYAGGATVDVAPRGRGATHAWATPEALADVDEALADALAATGADASRVVLAGFSMGGYGVYRKFLDAPGRYRALAVFSGHPDLANRWTGAREHPNVLDPAVAARFRGAAVFVFHGRRDRNTPFELTEEVAARLRAAGAAVELVVEDGAGHEAPSGATLERFREWLARVLAAP